MTPYSWGDGFLRLKEEAWIKHIQPQKYPKMGSPFMVAFEEEPGKGIWFGGSDGLRFWNDEKGEVEVFSSIQKLLGRTQIWSLKRDKNGLWVITVADGLYYIPLNADGKPEKDGRVFTPENSFLHSYYLHQVFIDSRGWMWIGYEGDGLQLIKNPNALQQNEPVNLINFNQSVGTENTIGGDKIRRIYEDRKGDIWLATMENGFTQIKIEKGQVRTVHSYKNDPTNPSSLSFNDGRSMYQQNDSTYWFATYGGGINRWNGNKQNFLRLTTANGLPNNSTYGILPDEDGIHLWISTNNGLTCLNTETLQFKTYTEEEGIQNKEFNTGAFLRLSDGRLVFGGISGFNIIDTKKLSLNTKKPPVRLTDIKLFNKSLESDSSSVFKKDLTLPYNKNFLSFEFAALDFENPLKNEYAYKMEGVDERWVESGSRSFADYPNLKPGRYAFRVKAANNDGIWNEEGTTLNLVITPPWWATWWFRTALGLSLFIGLITGIRYISQRRLREQIRNMELENKLRSERERISRDLHDYVGAQLANIISGLSLAKKYHDTKNEARSVELMNSLSGDASVTIKQLRETIWALNQNSLNLEGFIDYLKQYFKSQSALNHQLNIHYNLEAGEIKLSSTQALNIFRIIQEASQNTLKYAEAENLTISFKQQNGALIVSVKDDGMFEKGEPSIDGGYGFGNMKKRAAELDGLLEIDTNNGTEIKLTISL